jgi:hypothetical protein
MRVLRTNADRGTAMVARRIDNVITRLECCRYSDIQTSDLDMETKRHIALVAVLKWFRRRDPVQNLRENGL